MSLPRYFQTPSIVLKRISTGEADRVVTLFTKEYGKVVAVAKGVRKLKSTKKGMLEPGNTVDAYFVRTKSLPLLTQSRLLHERPKTRTSLQSIKKLSQILETVDTLTVEYQEQVDIFHQVTDILEQLESCPTSFLPIKKRLQKLIAEFGFYQTKTIEHLSIHDAVSQIAERKMRSFEYLTLQHTVVS